MSMLRPSAPPAIALLGIALLLATAAPALHAQVFGQDYKGIDTRLPATTMFPGADALPPGASSAPGFKLGNGANAAQVSGSLTTGIGTSALGTSHFNAATINLHKPYGDGDGALDISISAARSDGPGYFGGGRYYDNRDGGYGGYGGYGGLESFGPGIGRDAPLPLGADNRTPLTGPQAMGAPLRGRGGR